MSENEKRAYRRLLYKAMLDIRVLGADCQPRGFRRWSPLWLRRQYARSLLAGALANWLHNLPSFAERDFEGFNAIWFWDEYNRICLVFAPRKPDGLGYRQQFESDMAQVDEN